MRWTQKLSDGIKRGIRSFLNIQEASPNTIILTEVFDYETNAIKNRIWYRGDSEELSQLYEQINTGVDRYKFWACKSSPGMEMRKIHTGLPALMIDILSAISVNDMDISIEESKSDEDLWKEINKDNEFEKKLEKAIKEVLYIGDGAFKISFDTEISEYPIIEFYPGDRIELQMRRGRIREVIFKTVYAKDYKRYTLYEHYGYGYIRYKLYKGDREVPLTAIEETEKLRDVAFSTYQEGKTSGEYMLAVPIKIYESSRWEGRGQSVFDKKVDAYDSLDEAWSQWMDALRSGRSREYIPECLLPRNPRTGEIIKPNAFDNRYIQTGSDMAEGHINKIEVQQPEIPHESYAATYITALDLCLQGLLSPSTIGIDVKKMDNAEAQREKEKVTLYTRDAILKALREDIPNLVNTAIKAYNEFYRKSVYDTKVTVDFGEYANPSFESQIETVGKGKTQGVMSTEAVVDELYGDTKDEEWKKEEVRRLKAEQGITELEEPGLNTGAGGFQLNVEGEIGNAGKSNEPNLPNE